MQLLRAKSEDAATLTLIAFAAKRHWGYAENWIEEWKDVLTITAEYIEAHLVYIAAIDGQIVGFCGGFTRGDSLVLEHLWVRPAAMNTGIGRALFREAENLAAAAGAVRIVMEADPHAEGFYLRMGAQTVGQAESFVAGHKRFLPLMEKRLS